MASDSNTQNLSAAYELLKQWTDISEAGKPKGDGKAKRGRSSIRVD